MKQTPDYMASGKKKGPRRQGILTKIKGKSRKSLILMSLWTIVTATATILAFTVGGTLWVVASLISGVATALIAIATFDPNSVESTQKQSTPKVASARGNGVKQKNGKKPTQRKKVCSARCRNSTKPLTDCRCSCGGRTHGVKNRDA